MQNSDRSLEGIMVELNQNEKSNPPDWPDTVSTFSFFTFYLNK